MAQTKQQQLLKQRAYQRTWYLKNKAKNANTETPTIVPSLKTMPENELVRVAGAYKTLYGHLSSGKQRVAFDKLFTGIIKKLI